MKVDDRDINKVLKELNAHILQAANDTFPRGARKEYKPYWSNQ